MKIETRPRETPTTALGSYGTRRPTVSCSSELSTTAASVVGQAAPAPADFISRRGIAQHRARGLVVISISQLAARTGVTMRALRYYEDKGLLRPSRSPSGHRGYSPDEVALAHTVVLLRSLDVSIPDILKLTRRTRSADEMNADLKVLLSRRVKELERSRDRILVALGDLAEEPIFGVDPAEGVGSAGE